MEEIPKGAIYMLKNKDGCVIFKVINFGELSAIVDNTRSVVTDTNLLLYPIDIIYSTHKLIDYRRNYIYIDPGTPTMGSYIITAPTWCYLTIRWSCLQETLKNLTLLNESNG